MRFVGQRKEIVYKVIQPVVENIGDIKYKEPYKINNNLFLVPGDINLNVYEDRLGETWPSASVQPASIRVQIAAYKYIKYAALNCNAQIVLVDLGPNLGALNRTILGGCDYFITPLSPDLFSIKGTQNLGNKFEVWHDEWKNNLRKWNKPGSGIPSEDLPKGLPRFLGYVTQQHNIRNSKTGMTRGWNIYGSQVEQAVKDNIIDPLVPLGQCVDSEKYLLGQIPNLHSLVPYSLDAHKPVYKCGSADGLRGEHISKAKKSRALYSDIIATIKYLLNY